MALIIIDGERIERKALLARDAGGDHRIQAARQQHDGLAPRQLRIRSHGRALSATRYGRKPDQSSIRNSREQKAQSTRIIPFSSRMSLRSSLGKRASTYSKCTTEQRQPRAIESPWRTRTSRSSWNNRQTSA